MASSRDSDDKSLQISDSLTYDESKLLSTGYGLSDNGETISNLFRNNGYNSYTNSIPNALYGIDILGQPLAAPASNEQFGFTFFTRPLLNLSYDNIRNHRSFALMMQNGNTLAGYVRAILDPLGQHSCNAVDPLNPFIPILSNTVMSLSGWQTPVINSWTSSSDRVGGQVSMVDSAGYVNMVYPISATFRNIRTNPLGYLFHIWTQYQTLVYEGIMDPYPEFMAYNIIDYQSRIYRLTMDPSRRYVETISANFAGFPTIDNAAMNADFNEGSPMNKDMDTCSQTFQSMGANYYDPVLIYEFNDCSSMFNPIFADVKNRSKSMRRLWPSEFPVLSYRAYPWINEDTSELEWWISNDVHRSIMGNVNYSGY